MSNKKELNLEEMNQINGGFVNGQIYSVSEAKKPLSFNDDVFQKTADNLRKYNAGDQLIFLEQAANGQALVEDPKDHKRGYVDINRLC